MGIYKACDIRGVWGDEIDEATGQCIGRALGAMVELRGGGRVCLGGDFRASTPLLKRAVSAGLVRGGADVLDVGQVPTPIVYAAAGHHGCSHAVMVTASHNPPQYNGAKFVVGGRPAVPELVAELETLAGGDLSDADVPGRVRRVEPVADYTRWVAVAASELSGTRAAGLRVVVDGQYGAFSDIAPRVFADAGFTVVPLDCRIDGTFGGRTPNPAVDANLARLCRCVVHEHADLGVAFDGDGDRVSFVDHTGAVVRPEQIGAILAVRCFDRPLAVYDLKCASVFPRAVVTARGRPLMERSGHGFIKTTMIREQADLGVEISGHYFYKALGGGDDGLFTGLAVCHMVARAGTSLHDLAADYPLPCITPDVRLPVSGNVGPIVEAIARTCGGEVSRLDGVRAAYDDGWGVARESITEPVLTLRFEAARHEQLRPVIERFLVGVPDLRDRVLTHLGGQSATR